MRVSSAPVHSHTRTSRTDFTPMLPIPLAALMAPQIWYMLPLLVAVSLVYGATRHELLVPILQHAWRTAVWMIVFMGVIFVILLAMEWWV
jgi:hypothetical protein